MLVMTPSYPGPAGQNHVAPTLSGPFRRPGCPPELSEESPRPVDGLIQLEDGSTDSGEGVGTAALGIRAPPTPADTALPTDPGTDIFGDGGECILIERLGGKPRRLERVVRHPSTVSSTTSNSVVFRDRPHCDQRHDDPAGVMNGEPSVGPLRDHATRFLSGAP
jgi:hypothetical protein